MMLAIKPLVRFLVPQIQQPENYCLMDAFKNKDKTISKIYDAISNKFGEGFFSLPDFWDADNFAFCLMKEEKLIYISTWDFRKTSSSKIKCFAEFEIINPETKETLKIEKTMDDISLYELVKEITWFLALNSPGSTTASPTDPMN